MIQLTSLLNEILDKRSHAKMQRLFENATGTASNIQSSVLALGKELQAAGEDITDLEVQAAILSKALDSKGKIDQIEPSDIESLVKQVKEARGYKIQESGGGILHTLELIGAALGNTALLNVIAAAVEKVSGKQVDPKTLSAKIQKFVSALRKLTGLPAKAMEKFFALIVRALGGGETAQKIAGYQGTILVVAALFAIGLMFFPVLGGSPLMIVLSLTGLIGKGFELKSLWKHLMEAIEQYKKESGEGSEQLPDLQPT